MPEFPVVDLFAGPGGLGEGFSSCVAESGARPFHLALSIERDEVAHRTLKLRATFRRLTDPSAYYDYARAGKHDRPQLWDALVRTNANAAGAADREAWRATLGEVASDLLDGRIRSAIGRTDRWALIGGPPCQAYSLVGRSRMRRSHGDRFEADERHLLYQEYLKIVARHAPPVFVMENVKGLLSSEHDGGPIFLRILRDLATPRLAVAGRDSGLHNKEFVLRSEQYSIPQARHRVVIVGVRDDLPVGGPTACLERSDEVVLEDVVGDMPRVRSGLSSGSGDHEEWVAAVERGVAQIARTSAMPFGADSIAEVARTAAGLAQHLHERGSHFMEYTAQPKQLADWYVDPELGGLLGHRARSHMEPDLWRYLFAASYAQISQRSPTLRDFPSHLLPKHQNVGPGLAHIFADRFRVQLPHRPASTITSHLAKDGNYFIHFDPSQCRSLTVREAARLQTFPDNYLFEGGATSQYHQIGNAVPPLLARKVASVVALLLSR